MFLPRHEHHRDWYLKDWLRTLGKTQQWVADELDLQKSKISRKASGTTPYDRDDVNTISQLLGIEPHELLLPPEEAMQFRRWRASVQEEAKRLMADSQPKNPVD